jgi:hypothetical protein
MTIFFINFSPPLQCLTTFYYFSSIEKFHDCQSYEIKCKKITNSVFLTIVGCSNSTDRSEEKNNETKTESYSFVGTIKEINGNSALVSAKVFEGNPEGDVFVDLSVK